MFLFFNNYFLILKCQALVLKVIYSSSNIKSYYYFKKIRFKDLKFVTEHL